MMSQPWRCGVSSPKAQRGCRAGVISVFITCILSPETKGIELLLVETGKPGGLCYREGCEGSWPWAPALWKRPHLSGKQNPDRSPTPGPGSRVQAASPCSRGAPLLPPLTHPSIQRLLSKCSLPSLSCSDRGVCVAQFPVYFVCKHLLNTNSVLDV